MTTSTLQAPVTTTTQETTIPARELLIKDRCDSCGARAYIRAVSLRNGHELQFCRHHGLKFEAGLISQNFVIDNQESSLFENTKPDGGSAAS